ncbi:MAG: transposase, partial [Bacteroidetes bacterium SW_9_63_38]
MLLLMKTGKAESRSAEPGQQSIPPDVMERLKERLAGPEGFGSYKEIQQWLAEEQDLELCYSTVHGIVRYELDAKLKVPRPSHPKNQQEQVEFQRNLPIFLPSLESRRPVRLFCQDECRIGFMPITRRRITLSG